MQKINYKIKYIKIRFLFLDIYENELFRIS